MTGKSEEMDGTHNFNQKASSRGPSIVEVSFLGTLDGVLGRDSRRGVPIPLF